MKKLTAFVLLLCICFAFSSCALTYGSSYVGKAAEKLSVTYKDAMEEDYIEFLSTLREFSAELTGEVYSVFGTEDNFVISPLSVYMALAIAAEASSGNTRAEILEALDISYEELIKHTKTLYAFANREFKQTNAFGFEEVKAFEQLSNSIWLDKDVVFKEAGVASLNQNIHTDVFSVSFANGEGARLINKYIEDKTHGLIKGDITIDPSTAFVMMNTFYLKEIWNEFGRELSFTDQKYNFENTDGTSKITSLLQSFYFDGKAQQMDGYSTFFTVTDSGFGLYFILPDEGRALREVFSEDTIEEVLSIKSYGYVDDENRQLHHTRVLFPEFKVNFDKDIQNILSGKFEIRDLFQLGSCDFANLTDTEVYCSGVIHKCALEVNAKGIEGAAVTVMPMATSPAPPPYEDVYHDFVVDRAFGFVLTDPNGTIVFSGVLNELDRQ